MNVASASSQQGPWPPPGGPNSLPGGPHMRPLGPRLSGSNRPPRPFFVREIYKNGYLKRLPYNEKKSSALSKLMKTDRYWVVFSVHDDTIPFLELWTEPTEVASKPPQFMFPLAVCQHISPSLVPAGDHEWTFVVNFETVAIRFSCNSREIMEEWVDCIRHKLSEMGILNPKGNLYTKMTPTKTRNPMSPLPQPPSEDNANMVAAENLTNVARSRTSIVDVSDQNNQSFTTSIYLNQEPAPHSHSAPPSSQTAAKSANTSASTTTAAAAAQPAPAARTTTVETVTVTPAVNSTSTVATSVSTVTSASNGPGATSSVYLNKSNPTRHVTVIPINKAAKESSEKEEEEENNEPYYDAIPDVPVEQQPSTAKKVPTLLRKRQQSPSKQPQPPPAKLNLQSAKVNLPPAKVNLPPAKVNLPPAKVNLPPAKVNLPPPPPPAKEELTRKYSDNKVQPQRIKKKSQRSSSLGPLLDEQPPLASSMANTNSLESIDSNPRQKLPKGDLLRERAHGRIRATGAVPRRPLAITNSQDPPSSPTHLGSPPRQFERPPPYHIGPPGPPMPGTHPPHPPHIPLPGLTCQLSLMLPQPQPAALSGSANDLQHHLRSPTLREQQVYRLRQEIAHPAGVRLTLRKRDCQNSLALVDIFGCLWVAGWKQRDFPILFNAFHVGDQILSVAGQPVRTASDFNKLVKSKTSNSGPNPVSGNHQEVLHVEIIVRRLPFAQGYHLKREVDGQPLGLVLNGNTAEVREIVPGSPAAAHGMTARVRSLDGQTLVAWHITEVNGRPLNLLAKDGEATSRLQALGRDVSVLIQPSDFLAKLRKQLKAHKNYKEYLMC